MAKTTQDLIDECIADHQAAMRTYTRLRAAGIDATPPKPLSKNLRYRYLLARRDAERANDDHMSGTFKRDFGRVVGRC